MQSNQKLLYSLSQFEDVLKVDLLRFEAPVLYEGNSFEGWIDSGHGAHLLGDINTLLGSLQLGDHLGGCRADLLGLQVTLLLDMILCYIGDFIR